ncbi:MAG: CPBP family glutamic-type intramembrane protease [Thermoleophilaceae bacterium]
MSTLAHPAPPQPPELPEGADPRPRWPWWYAFAGFAAGFIGSNILATPVIILASDDGDLTPAGALLSTLILNAVLVGTAVGFAWMTSRPRAWHFGLTGTRFWPAVGWSALGYVAYITFVVAYGLIVGTPEEQTTPEDVGADEGTFGLINAGLLFVVIAPIGEELFFRGFFYRALRGSMNVWSAALVGGGVFGAIHIFTGWEAVPVLAALGVVLCLVYERTGSLYPCIALHVINNTLAYAVTTDASPALAAAFGAPMILACVMVPRLQRRVQWRP